MGRFEPATLLPRTRVLYIHPVKKMPLLTWLALGAAVLGLAACATSRPGDGVWLSLVNVQFMAATVWETSAGRGQPGPVNWTCANSNPHHMPPLDRRRAVTVTRSRSIE
jgi:hypothetical protein